MQRQLIEAGMTLAHERMMYADGVLLPHLAACFQDQLCYLFSCLLICLKGDSPVAPPASGWAVLNSSCLCLLVKHHLHEINTFGNTSSSWPTSSCNLSGLLIVLVVEHIFREGVSMAYGIG